LSAALVAYLFHSQLAPKDSHLVVEILLDAIAHSLASANRIEIRGFGIFRLNYRRARASRNLKTGQNVQVPCKSVFKAGKELRERVNHSEV
jgi:integration host factor subunit beta